MKPRFLVLAVLAVLAPLHAAEPPRYFVLHQEIVKPSMVPQYEQTTKEFLALVQQHRSASPGFWFTTFADHDSVYSFVAPIQSFASIDGIQAGFEAMAKAAGPKWADLMKRSGEPMEYVRESVLMEDPSLSYTLFQRAFALSRRFEQHEAWIRPDLSLPPVGMKEGR